jgi:hypothetical protein
MRALHPKFSRIFFTPQAFKDPDKMQSSSRSSAMSSGLSLTIRIMRCSC